MRRQQVLSPRWVVIPVAVIVLFMSGFSALRPGPRAGSVAPSPAGSISVAVSEESHFSSQVLGRDLPYTVFLPPGYDSGVDRYPVLYMLHGLSATHEEWTWYGLFETAADLMQKGEILPFIIVLPQGDDAYWVDHADDGPQWGEYLAREVVGAIDARFRTIPQASKRAVGGLSMGADGALQLAMDYPGVFGIVGAHSPVLRPFETAPAYYGNRDFFEAHYPVTLMRRDPAQARQLIISIDAGVADQWVANVEAFHEELLALGIPHEWHAWPGVHDAAYWTAHVPDDLRFYGAAFNR